MSDLLTPSQVRERFGLTRKAMELAVWERRLFPAERHPEGNLYRVEDIREYVARSRRRVRR
jgi:hypothetical protein